MLTRRFWIALSLLALGITAVVQAQDGQPITQPTVDAAVATLIAQTGQAPLKSGGNPNYPSRAGSGAHGDRAGGDHADGDARFLRRL